MICLYTVIFRRLKQREKARSKRKNLRRSLKNPNFKAINVQGSTLRLIENERISSALIGGTRVARQVGTHIKAKTDQMLKELSLQVCF